MSTTRSTRQTLLPINALFVGDIVTQLIFVFDTDTIAEVAVSESRGGMRRWSSISTANRCR
jgi:toluene monooxygenase system protein B